MILRHLLFLCAWLSIAWAAALKSKNNRVCSDGTSPLHEGGDDNIFPCVYECPTGFTCENQSKFTLSAYIPSNKFSDSPEGGICCADLDALYEIYADKSQRDAKSDQVDGQLDDAFDLPNVPNVPVVIVDQKEPSKNQAEQIVGNSIEPVSEIRRSPVRSTTTPEPVTIVTLSATRSKTITLAPTQPPFVAQPKKLVGLNCRRQPLQHKCNSGTTPTQYVVRWYKQNGACHHYIYGYCPGTRIDLDHTLRTKDDCEALCLSAEEFEESDLFKFLAKNVDDKNGFSIKSHAAPLIKSAEKIDLNKEKPIKNDEVVSFSSNNDTPMDLHDSDMPEETTLAPQKHCNRVVPYRSLCPDGLPSQFTIRWHSQNGNCVAYGFGYCHGESVVDNKSLKSKEECLRYCPGVSKNSAEQVLDISARLIR